MAQLGLAILAVPETTVELFKLAKVAVERIQTFRYASKFSNELKTFGYDLCDGQLHLAVQLVEGFIINDGDGRSGNEEIKTLAEKYLDKLRAGLMEAQGILDKCVDGDGQVKRLYYLSRRILQKCKTALRYSRGIWGKTGRLVAFFNV